MGVGNRQKNNFTQIFKMAFGLKTYADGARREDLLDILANINPQNRLAIEAYNEGVSQRPKPRKQSRQKYIKSAKLLSKWMKLTNLTNS